MTCVVSESSLGRAKEPQAYFLGARVLGERDASVGPLQLLPYPEFSSYPTDVVYLPVCHGAQCGYLLST